MWFHVIAPSSPAALQQSAKNHHEIVQWESVGQTTGVDGPGVSNVDDILVVIRNECHDSQRLSAEVDQGCDGACSIKKSTSGGRSVTDSSSVEGIVGCRITQLGGVSCVESRKGWRWSSHHGETLRGRATFDRHEKEYLGVLYKTSLKKLSRIGATSESNWSACRVDSGDHRFASIVKEGCSCILGDESIVGNEIDLVSSYSNHYGIF